MNDKQVYNKYYDVLHVCWNIGFLSISPQVFNGEDFFLSFLFQTNSFQVIVSTTESTLFGISGAFCFSYGAGDMFCLVQVVHSSGSCDWFEFVLD